MEFERAKMQAEHAKIKDQISIDKERMQDEIALKEIESVKQEIELQVSENKATEEILKQDQLKANAERELAQKRAEREEREALSRFRRGRILGWLKTVLLVVLSLLLVIYLLLASYRAYRWVTEEPLIKEVERVVEVEKQVEKIVEVEKEVTVTEIPDECTQIRRNGEIYVSCDGVTVSGSPTIGDSGLKEIPDLVTE